MTSGIDPEENFAVIEQAAKDAHTHGASMLFTPEMSLLLDRDRKRAAPHIVSQSASPYLKRFVAVAAEQTLCMTVGLPVLLPTGRYANRQMLFTPTAGSPVCYDKIHMFDVELSTGETWRESSAYQPGEEVVTAELLSRTKSLAGSPATSSRYPSGWKAAANSNKPGVSNTWQRSPTKRRASWKPRRRARNLWSFACGRSVGRSAARYGRRGTGPGFRGFKHGTHH